MPIRQTSRPIAICCVPNEDAGTKRKPVARLLLSSLHHLLSAFYLALASHYDGMGIHLVRAAALPGLESTEWPQWRRRTAFWREWWLCACRPTTAVSPLPRRRRFTPHPYLTTSQSTTAPRNARSAPSAPPQTTMCPAEASATETVRQAADPPGLAALRRGGRETASRRAPQCLVTCLQPKSVPSH